jgi:hypothetical protein
MKLTLFFLISFGITSVAHAGGWDDFAKGFAETSADIREQRECERTYSPAMCSQMKADREYRESQAEQDRRMQMEMMQIKSEINRLKQEQQQDRSPYAR